MDELLAQVHDLPRITPQPDGRAEPFALTDIQQAYLIGRHKGLELGGVSSHYYLELDGPGLDIPRLTDALSKVVARHDVLRAVTGPDSTQRILAVADTAPCHIRTEDLRGKSADEQHAALERTRAALTDQVLPTDSAPPFDIRASILGDDSVRLHLSVDLLFVDIRSLFLLLDEWRRFYDDPAWAPAPLELSFRDYALAHQKLREGEWGSKAAAYWNRRLDALPPAPELPLATAPEQLGTPTFLRKRAVLSPERSAALADRAQRQGLSRSALLLAAYAEVIRTWSKRQDFTLTLTQFHRLPLHPQVDRIMGDFLSPSLLSVTASPEETFAERAQGVQQRLREDLAHAAHSGIQVLRDLSRRSTDGRGVSMPVVFSSTLDGAAGAPTADAFGAFGELVHAISQTPQIWLENQVFEENGRLTLNWNAVQGLFPEGVLDAMFDAYLALLDRIVADDALWDTTRSVVPLPAAQARERAEANATAADIPPARLHELVAAGARRNPDAIAVIASGTETTYRTLTENAHRLAHRLRGLGTGTPGTLTAVSMSPGADQYSALLGVLHSGAAYVAIDPELPEERRHKLLQRCGAKAVVTEPGLREKLTWPEGIEVVTLHEQATQEQPVEAPESRQDYDDLAYVIFTSGSTGEPKGVMISHRSAANTVQDINQRFGVDAEDRVLALAPTGFDLSVYDVFGVLGAGGTVVVPDPKRSTEPTHWTQLVSRYGVTIWNSVPAPMRMWVESLGGTAPRGCRLRLALLSGDWIPIDLPNQIRAVVPGMQVISLGGATEGSIWSIHHPIREVRPEWTSIPYGKALANQTMHVYNRWLAPSPIGVTGEIYIGGTGVAQGYLGDPERTAERFFVHPDTGERIYKTGDLGRYLPGGDIEILGREDFQVKINGYRVELGEIEAALVRRPEISTALVTAPVHVRTGQRQLAAYLVTDGGEVPDPAVLRESLAELLPSYMMPSHFVTLDTLPLTPNGKIDQKALPTPWNEADDESADRAAPRNELEQKLLALWAQELGHSNFGVDEGFFDVGGDSLYAVGILRLLREEFGIGPDDEQDIIEGLFMNYTLAEFAEMVVSLKESAV